MKSQKFCCELNVRYESMIDDLQDRVKDLKQKQKDAYLLELDLRGKIIDLEKALANKRSAWTEQGLHLANAQKERDHYKERAIFLRDERDEAVRQWERFERMAGDNWAALKAQAGEPVAWMNKRGDVISAEEKTLIIENGKLGYPGGEFDLHAKNIERSYTIPLGVINV